MASSGIDIRIGADVNDAVSGVNDVDDALEKVSKQLDDVGRDGTRDVDKLEKSISDLNHETLQSKDKLDRAFGRDFKNKIGDAKDGMTDFKQEANQTARETAASFDGSTESIKDMFQELSANAFAGFGAAGAAAGFAAAVGIGVVGSVLTKIEEDAKASQSRIGELASEMIDAGGLGSISLGYAADELKKILTGAGEGSKALDNVKKSAKTAGVAVGTMAEAYAGNEEALDMVLKKTDEHIDQLVKERALANDENTAAWDSEIAALELVSDELTTVKNETEAAKKMEEDWLASGGQAIRDKAAAIQSIDSAYDSAAASILDYVNQETGILDTEAYIQSMKDREKALLDYQTTLASANFTPEQEAALEKMGQDQAETFMSAWKNGTASQKKDLEAILSKTASDSSGVAKDVVDATFAKPTDAVIKTTVDAASVTAAKKAIQDGIETGAYKITVKAFDKNGKPVD